MPVSTKKPIEPMDDSVFCNPKPAAPFFFTDPVPGPYFDTPYSFYIDDEGNYQIIIDRGEDND